MILPHVTDFDKVLSGEITQVCFKLKPAPDFAGSTPGTQYVYETRDDITGVWADDGTDASFARVVTVWGNTGGWLTGDLPVDADWHSQVKWGQECEYSVQRGGGKPALWWKCDGGKIAFQDATHYRPTDTLDGYDYEIMQRVDMRSAWQHQGYQPLRVRITGIDQVDVRELLEADAWIMGYKSLMYFWALWTDRHDRVIFLRENADSWDLTRYNTKRNGHVDRRVPGHPYTHVSEQFVRRMMSERPAPRYTAWMLKFEAVKD